MCLMCGDGDGASDVSENGKSKEKCMRGSMEMIFD